MITKQPLEYLPRKKEGRFDMTCPEREEEEEKRQNLKKAKYSNE